MLDGRIVAIADVLGDWREELILTKNGELRIATTSIPSTSRHVHLMQDPLYRNDVAHASMGYFYPPNTSYPLFPDSFK
jgi:rhamnogalacturonan endolyase